MAIQQLFLQIVFSKNTVVKILIKNTNMEMQASIQYYVTTDIADGKTVHYSQGFMQAKKTIENCPARKMKELFSGCGKAEKNMGMAAIPPLCPFELKIPCN